MEWETELLERKIGRLEGVEAIEDVEEGVRAIENSEREARQAVFQALVCRTLLGRFPPVWALERAGFQLMDVGVTFRYELERAAASFAVRSPRGVLVRDARPEDLPALAEMVKGLFLTSYYYVSPFFSEQEADLLYQAWLSNSVKKVRADRLLLAEAAERPVGFVTCRRLSNGEGVIDLIGVAKSHFARGIGKALIASGLECFRQMRVAAVNVRTQISNAASVNSYISTGARFVCPDVTFMKSLAGVHK